MTELKGLHHVTAMTDDAERNYKFFTEVLGMRLVKKTVNQDDIHTYHTFFADDKGNAGTDMTFFDFPHQGQGSRGTNSISRTSFRVPSDESLNVYKKRFEEFGVTHEAVEELFGKKILKFEESDGQRYMLISDENNEGVAAGIPWQEGPVDTEHAIYGLGPIEITVSYFDQFKETVKNIYGFKEILTEEDVSVLEMGEGGNGAQVILRKDNTSTEAMQGYGEVHHVAFRVADNDALNKWRERYQELRVGNSGIVDRFYFEALYARIGHILIEISTDGPGFMEDEPYETMGEKLSLPPFLEEKREEIEAEVRPFDTTRSKGE